MSFVPLQDNTPNSINKALEELHGLITTVRQVAEKKEVTPVTEVIPTTTTPTVIPPLAELPTPISASTGADEDTINVVDAYVVFSWNNIGSDKSYELQHKPSTATDYINVSVASQVSGNITCRVGNLQCGITVNWRVRSVYQGTYSEWANGTDIVTWSPSFYISKSTRNFEVPHSFGGGTMNYVERTTVGTTTLTVPAGKAWYLLTTYYANDIKVNDVSVIYTEGVRVAEYNTNIFYYDTILKAGDHIDMDIASGVGPTWLWYWEVEEDAEITPVVSQLFHGNSHYTVPAGKMLVIRRLTCHTDTIHLMVNGKNFFYVNTVPYWRDIALFVSQNSIVETSDFNLNYFWGYLIPM